MDPRAEVVRQFYRPLPASIQGTLPDLPESSDIVETKQKYALVMLTVLWDVQGGNLSARSALLLQ